MKRKRDQRFTNEEDEKSCMSALAESCRAQGFGKVSEETSDVTRLKSAFELCTCYRTTGCVLAWMVIRGSRHPDDDAKAWEFIDSWSNFFAKHKSAPLRQRGAIFPLRLGDLDELVEVFKRVALAEIADAAFVVLQWARKAWVYVAASALNRMTGLGTRLASGPWSKAEKRAFDSMASAVERRFGDDPSLPPLDESAWQKDMSSRSVGYNGEEISICQQLTLEQVMPGLPPSEHGGCIDALDWVGHRTKQFLLNPKWLLKSDKDVTLPKLPGKIHLVEHDREALAFELVKRNVCDWIPLDSVHSVQGCRILNGLFGVVKPSSLEDGRPILRLIMNLVGTNSCMQQMEGGTTSLPGITHWMSIVLDGDQQIRIHQSDMCSVFYLFRLPPVWKRYLSFNLTIDGERINRTKGCTYCLACCVIPMGWLNSVSIMQELSENLLLRGGMPADKQVARGHTLPRWMNDLIADSRTSGCSWWHIYLDNYAGGERVEHSTFSHDANQCHWNAEDIWADAGVVSATKKRVVGALKSTELGAEIDGERKMIGLGGERLLKLIQGTLWLIAQPRLNRKQVQIMAGRWVFALQFRRPAMSFLQKTWKFVGQSLRLGEDMRKEIKAEFLSLIFVSSLLHCNLGASIPSHIICTDASERGGSIEVAHELIMEGADFLQAVNKKTTAKADESCPILIISLFNGIGGAFRAYDIAGITPMARIAVDLDEAANRITSRRWPGTLIINDVRLVDRTMVKSWSLKFLNIAEIHVWAGWPCVDLSSVKANRMNLAGPQSSLFWEIPRIRDLLEEEFGPIVVIRHVLENVASMDESAAQEISQYMGTSPYQLDSSDAVPMRRPRFVWTSESIESAFPDLTFKTEKYWTRVQAMATYPSTEQWLTPGYRWEGEHRGAIFPTCLKSIPRDKPPPQPAGLSRCSTATKERWQSDNFRVWV
eukprot:Skav234857  [mRNA]  locus=scaffold840:94910:97994:- [translate_table: standard]